MSIQRAAIATSAALLLMGQTASDPATNPAADGAGQASPDPITAEQAIAAAQELYGPPPPEPEVSAECSNPAPGEIVVCAALEEQSQFRIPSSSDKGDDSQLSWAGDPPDVSGPGIFTGPATVGGICGIGLNPCPPPPVYYFDITALPEPPPGSDADKIAKGETPE